MTSDFVWIESIPFRDPQRAHTWLRRLRLSELPADQRSSIEQRLCELLPHTNDPDAALANLARWITEAHDLGVLSGLLQRSPESLSGLLQMLSRHEHARHLISDPCSAELLQSAGQAWHDREVSHRTLAAPLLEQLRGVDQWHRAAVLLRRFYSRQLVRVALAEFVGGLPPDRVGRQLALATDATIEGALQFVTERLAERRGLPQRTDGTTPRITVLGLGNLGGQELSYSSPIKLVFLYDAIDEKNVWHRDFYHALVGEVVQLLQGDKSRSDGMDIDLREGPRHEVGVSICSFRQALRTYETSGRIWQRLSFVKARVVAGSAALGQDFLQALQPWVYQPYMNRVDLAEMRTLRSKMQRRSDQQASEVDVVRSAGGRDDVELTIQFLQLLHGASVPAVRCVNTTDAILALGAADCLTLQESTLLLENYARLCRLQHQLAVMFDRRGRQLPPDAADRRRLAWHLGVTVADGSDGDLDQFESLLRSTMEKNRRVINHLIVDAPAEGPEEVAIETELILDPDPDPEDVEQALRQFGLQSPHRAMDDLRSLAAESVPFLSPHRCRHFLSAIAPALLTEIAATPFPDQTLSSLDIVADSLGAKATLWELLARSRPTMQLLVRLCAGAPYLTEILTNNPGMIDELIDSLLTDRLPSAGRLEALSVQLCRAASDVELILQSFKSGAHLMIGVRDVLGKESLESAHRALCDTAESCLRRIIDYEQEALAEQYGDPVDPAGGAAELIAVAVGKFGGREPNYHSDLDVLFLYTADGETRRRIGGHRQTLTNRVFFNQLVDRVVARTQGSSQSRRLYELDLHWRAAPADAGAALSATEFFGRCGGPNLPLLQRLELCRARPVSGSRAARGQIERAIEQTVTQLPWQAALADELSELRRQMESTAHPTNLKRGCGGTLDVELLAQLLALKHAAESPEVLQGETAGTLTKLASSGYLEPRQAAQLIEGYRTLRRIEANLRLMNTPRRHELPVEDPEEMRRLAYLMHESDPDVILARCETARAEIRNGFTAVLASLAD